MDFAIACTLRTMALNPGTATEVKFGVSSQSDTEYITDPLAEPSGC